MAEASVIKVGKAGRLAELMKQEGISITDASLVLDHLNRKDKAGDEPAEFQFSFKCHPWDGAIALGKAINAVFGFSFGESTFNFSEGQQLPLMVEIQTGTKPEEKISVPWGKLTLPGVEGTITPESDGNDTFILHASIRRKHEEQVKVLVEEMRRILKEESIYQGKAVRLDWEEQMLSEPLLTPSFMQLAGLDESQLVLNASVREEVEISLFTPIDKRQEVKDAGIEWRRGVLLWSSEYGTGKTLAATITAAKAEAAGITFVMCDGDKLDQALQFAKGYTPAVVFCEDIDGNLIATRTAQVNDMLNELDGVTSKETDVMVVFTTNSVDSITKAALRPGRCDAVIEFSLPDAHTAEALIRRYAGSALAPSDDIAEAVRGLVGNSPAVIAEATKRARLAAIRTGEKVITPALLITATRTMQGQIALLRRAAVVTPSQLEKAADVVGRYLEQALRQAGRRDAVAAVAGATVKNGKEGTVYPAVAV